MKRLPQILMIEDNPDEAYLIQLGLENCMPGLKVTVVTDECSTMAYLARLEEEASLTPRLILLDLYIPSRNDGLRVLACLKAHFQKQKITNVPIVVLSLSDQAADVEACYDLGVSAYIVKSANYQNLMSFCQVFYKYWFETVVLPPRYN